MTMISDRLSQKLGTKEWLFLCCQVRNRRSGLFTRRGCLIGFKITLISVAFSIAAPLDVCSCCDTENWLSFSIAACSAAYFAWKKKNKIFSNSCCSQNNRIILLKILPKQCGLCRFHTNWRLEAEFVVRFYGSKTKKKHWNHFIFSSLGYIAASCS